MTVTWQGYDNWNKQTRQTLEKARKHSYDNGTGPPLHDSIYITLRGYGKDRSSQLSALCGEVPPTITDGYAIWSTVPRPLRTGVTTFQGYNPAKMSVSLRLGQFSGLNTGIGGWGRDAKAGVQTEADVSILEWMAGANFGSGYPPIIYVNSYGDGGGSTGLVPWNYQNTVDAGSRTDHRMWPWVIDGGIKWGVSYRNKYGDRTYQECTFDLLNYLGFTKPSTQQAKGAYIKTTTERDTIAKIARASGAIDIDSVVREIKLSPSNNPVKGTKKRLNLKDHPPNTPIGKSKSGKSYEIWVPGHVV